MSTKKVPDSGWKCCKIGHEKFIKNFKKEVTSHHNFIKKEKGVDTIYRYTKGSINLRDNEMYFYDLNELINNAPYTTKIFKYIKEKEDKMYDNNPYSLVGGPTTIDELTLDMFHNEQGFISENSPLPQFKNISKNLPVKVKKIKLYEIETC